MNIEQKPIALWASTHNQIDNDCACAVTSPVAEQALNPSIQSWTLPPHLHYTPITNTHTLFFNPTGQFGPVVLNQAAEAVLNDFAEEGSLNSPTAQQLANLDLLQAADSTTTLPQDQTDTLTAWLHVTNECNLRCVYCYIEKTDEAMDEQMGLAAVDAIFRSAIQHGFSTVKLKYAGGEATLNFKLVKTLHHYAQQLAEQSGLTLQAVVLSNGIALSKDLLSFLHHHDIRLMISLDGLGAEHDAQRPFINGKGSYKLVAWGVDRAIAHGVKPYLSITVTGKNTKGVAKAVAFALDRELLFNLNFYRDNDPAMSDEELRAEDENLITGMQAVFTIIEERLPKQSLIGSLIDRSSFSGLHRRSCGAGQDYMVIDQRGGVSRCQMEIDQPVSNVTASDPLDVIRLETKGFQNLPVEEKEGCRDCTWRYWCAGGCSLLTYRVTGRNDVKSPYCNVYKALYPEMLRLEGLRLLKWHAQGEETPQ